MEHHLVSRADPGNQCPDFTHDTGNVVAQYVRQRNINAWQSSSRPHVEVIQGTGFHFDQNIVCFDGRIRRVSVFQDFWPAVSFEDNSFHGAEILDFCFGIATRKGGAVGAGRWTCRITNLGGTMRLKPLALLLLDFQRCGSRRGTSLPLVRGRGRTNALAGLIAHVGNPCSFRFRATVQILRV